jgi:hypothetical protein
MTSLAISERRKRNRENNSSASSLEISGDSQEPFNLSVSDEEVKDGIKDINVEEKKRRKRRKRKKKREKKIKKKKRKKIKTRN